MRKLMVIGWMLVAFTVYADQKISKVIELYYIDATKATQLLKPLLKPDDKISGSGNTLVVNVSPDTLTQIRNVLHQVDVPPVTFTITVYQGPPNWLHDQKSTSVVYSTDPQYERNQSQSVQVMNGSAAFISSGKEVPIVTEISSGNAYGPGPKPGVGNRPGNGSVNGFYNAGIAYQQKNVKNGLLVIPELQGSQVKLKIKRIREQEDVAGGQQFDNQNIDTTLMVPLDKWVSLGSAEQGVSTDTMSSSDVEYSAGRPYAENSTLYVKVTVSNKLKSGYSK